MGMLDQGFWPDGLYTAPTDAALAYDIELTKQIGMNMLRKHVKVSWHGVDPANGPFELTAAEAC